ncbi:unnamed protein product [Ectocarpus sp. CCAP 1310/34]|nr:unnamed protein product [Ectocarpus sp. CCAP 1310/34]
MESLVAAVTRNGWQRTSEPVCYPERSKGKWRLRLMFTSRKGDRATKKYGPLCNTEQEALCGSLAFRYSWEGSQRGQPCEVSKENLVPPVAAGKSLNSLGIIGRPQERQFKRQRRAGSDATRAEFAMQQMLTSREKRSIERGWRRRDRKLRKAFDQRGAYLGGRIKDLTANVAANEQHIKRLQDALRTGHLPSLLLPLPLPSVEDGENAGDRTWAEDTGKPPEEKVAEKQIIRLWQQAYSSLEVLKEERERDVKQLELTRKANEVLSGCKHATDAAVKEADAERFDLLNEASLVRHEASLLRMAAKVAGSSPQAYAPSTILRWLRDFRKEGGFRRDARGAHEPDWIMSEEDLKSALLAWMISQPRFTIKDVCKYINGPLLQDDKEDLSRLHAYQVNLPVSMSTTHSWMIRLGCRYERATKSFYTDTHEKKEVVEYRGEYIEKRRKMALRQPLWVRVQRAALKQEEVDRLDSLKSRGPEGDFYAEVYDCKIDGQDCIEFHVDLLRDDGSVDNFDKLRAALGPEGGDYSVRFDQAAAAQCEHFHPPNKCRCGKKVHHIGQDESAYKAYAREGKEWVIRGVRGLRKKTEGPGEMVSGFQDERHGFGLPISDADLAAVNAKRDEEGNGKKNLTRSPGLRFLEYGKGKDGYWGYDQFEEQVEDVMDVLEHIDPDMQIVFEVDHSSGHGKQREDGLHVSNMNVKYGGKQKVLRDSVMTEECLGPEEAKMYFANGRWSTKFSEGAVCVDQKLTVGQTQTSTFAVGAPPPFFEWDAPRKDKKNAKGKVKEGYEGKAKGVRQYLWERGWWKDGMSTGAGVSDDMHVEKVLQALPDFKNERTALQHLVESRGHILLSSPKCHPEVAGVGIEYSWGFSKQKFRRKINDEVPKHLHDNIEKSLCIDKYLTIGRVRRFARRTRDYCRAYREIALRGVVIRNKEFIEKMRKIQKAHRNILDMETSFLGDQ